MRCSSCSTVQTAVGGPPHWRRSSPWIAPCGRPVRWWYAATSALSCLRSAARRSWVAIGGAATGAVHHFKDRWEYSLKKIKETAEKTAEKVTSAADGYDQVDTAVANAAAGTS